MKRNTIWLSVFIVILIVGAILIEYLPRYSPTANWVDVNLEVTDLLSGNLQSEEVEPAMSESSAPSTEKEIASTLAAATMSTVKTSQAGYTNLNAATAEQLDSLPGIGPTKAQAIIEYRTLHGPFTSIDQLMEVKGIGAKTYEKMKDIISIQ